MISLLLAKIGIQGIVGAIVACVIAFYAVFLRADNDHLASELDAARKDVGRLTATVADREAIDQQNKAIESYKAQSDYLVARIKGAGAKLASIAKKSGAEIQRIEAAPGPADCTAAVSWLAAEAPGIVSNWNRK